MLGEGSPVPAKRHFYFSRDYYMPDPIRTLEVLYLLSRGVATSATHAATSTSLIFPSCAILAKAESRSWELLDDDVDLIEVEGPIRIRRMDRHVAKLTDDW